MTFNLTYNNNHYYFNISMPEWTSNNMPSMIQSTSGEIIKDKSIEKKIKFNFFA